MVVLRLVCVGCVELVGGAVSVSCGDRECALRAKRKGVSLSTDPLEVPATCYSPTGEPRSTLADEALHFRVRDGNGCCVLSMATGKENRTFLVGTRSKPRLRFMLKL